MTEERNIAHDYRVRLWGHDYNIFRVIDGGLKLDACGWWRGVEVGHYILFSGNDPSDHDKVSIYKVDEIRYTEDPPDMWFAMLSYVDHVPDNLEITW